MPKSGTYFETVPFNENDFKLKDDAAASTDAHGDTRR